MQEKDGDTILVVDDSPFSRSVIAALLNEEGYHVIVCENADNVVDMFRENNVTVVLTDIRMPQTSGLDLLRHIHFSDRDIPVLLMTAYAELDTAADAIKKGAFDFLIKPCDPDYLTGRKKDIEAGKARLNEADFNLQTTLDGISRIGRFQSHKKGLDLLCRIHPDVPVRLKGDEVRLWQIMINLTGNAVRFTDKGNIYVYVGREGPEKDTKGQDDQTVLLHFYLSDTGIGIPEDKRDVIFENFTRIDGSSTRKYGGTGLGLTISRNRKPCTLHNIFQNHETQEITQGNGHGEQ